MNVSVLLSICTIRTAFGIVNNCNFPFFNINVIYQRRKKILQDFFFHRKKKNNSFSQAVLLIVNRVRTLHHFFPSSFVTNEPLC
jgi:hypothetical protein